MVHLLFGCRNSTEFLGIDEKLWLVLIVLKRFQESFGSHDRLIDDLRIERRNFQHLARNLIG